MQKGKET